MHEVFVLDAVRTPIGRYGGALAEVRPDDLAAHVLRSLVDRSSDLDPARIDDVCSATRTAPARTTATSPGWQRFSPVCPPPFRGRR